MPLEMKVHRDITSYEAKPMWGLTWRRIAALAIMIVGGGGVFFGVTAAILKAHHAGWDSAELSSASTYGMYAMFPVIVPVALWAWLKPMGLKPEIYFQYLLRHQLTAKVITYVDTYGHRANTAARERGEPVPDGLADEPAQRRSERRGKADRKKASRSRKRPSEHAPQQKAGRADRSRRPARQGT